MKKLGLVFSLTFLLSPSIQISAQTENDHLLDSIPNYLPLNIGNEWQYLTSSDFPDGYQYKLSYSKVEADTFINGFKYYLNSNMPSFIRYSQTDQKIYYHWEDSDYVYIDFNIANGSSYQSFWDGELHSVYSESGNHFFFNQDRTYGGYLYLPGYWGYREYYTDSIGLSYARSATSNASSAKTIIQVILFDSEGRKIHFTNHYKPVFTLQPIITISSSSFYLPFTINHHYTKVVTGPFSSGLDFIDSVKMISYYAKDDSVISNSPIIPEHSPSPVNINYLINAQLDTALLKNGFTFNYKFTAKDKGIIPEYSSSPDSGYYICSWDENTTINESLNIPKKFSLSQNYPNPFNPKTTIQYTICTAQFVTLKVYDLLGREVAALVNQEKPAGNYNAQFTINDVQASSGIYFYRLQAGDFVETKKMILLK